MAGPRRHRTRTTDNPSETNRDVYYELRPGFGDFHLVVLFFYALAQSNAFIAKEPRYFNSQSRDSYQMKRLPFKMNIYSIAIIEIIICHLIEINLYRHCH